MPPKSKLKTKGPAPARRPKAEDPNDMPRLRAEILAAFCAPAPTSPLDLRDRAIMVGAVARWLCNLPEETDGWNADGFGRFNAKYAEVAAELERMLAAGIVMQPHADLMDHHKPPKDTYTLTPLGAAQAMAVLAVSRAAAAGGAR